MFIRYRTGIQGCSPGERMTVGHAGVRGLHAVLNEHSPHASITTQVVRILGLDGPPGGRYQGRGLLLKTHV